MIAKEAWEDARAGAVESIKAHLTDPHDDDGNRLTPDWHPLPWTDKACGDYPAPCNCDDPETHDGAVSAETTADELGG